MSDFSFLVDAVPLTSPPVVPEGEYSLDSQVVELGTERLIEFFKQAARNRDMMKSLLEPVQDAENALWALYTAFDPRTAVGDQLDILGGLVGEERDGRSDADYRVGILVRVLVNTSDGTIEQLLAIAGAMVPTALTSLLEFFPASVRVDFDTLGSLNMDNIYELLREAKGGGVSLRVGDGRGGAPIGSTVGSPVGFKIGSSVSPPPAQPAGTIGRGR